jgi:transcriptional regulator with XRE-family HTH domain
MLNEKKLLRALGTQIKAARKAKGLTQERLAELCDFDPTYVSLLERGLRNPPFMTICKLAYELDCPLKCLFEKVE